MKKETVDQLIKATSNYLEVKAAHDRLNKSIEELKEQIRKDMLELGIVVEHK